MRYAKPAYESCEDLPCGLPSELLPNEIAKVSFRPNRLSCSKSSGNTILSGPQSRQRLTTPEH